MSKPIEIEILRDLAAGREVSNERILGASFTALLDRRMVALDNLEPCIMPAWRAWLKETDDYEARKRSRNNAARRGRDGAMRDVGMRRTRGGSWE